MTHDQTRYFHALSLHRAASRKPIGEEKEEEEEQVERARSYEPRKRAKGKHESKYANTKFRRFDMFLFMRGQKEV